MELTDKQICELLEKTHKDVDRNTIFFDNIVCTECGYDGLVNVGEEICPNCKEDGTLAWKKDQPQEVCL